MLRLCTRRSRIDWIQRPHWGWSVIAATIDAGSKFELLATNELGERITASPAISGNELIRNVPLNLPGELFHHLIREKNNGKWCVFIKT